MNRTPAETKIPDWVAYPEEEWGKITPHAAGFDAEKSNKMIANAQVKGAAWEGEAHEGNEWGAVLTRGGYLVQTWGNADYRYQTASVGKAFSRALIGLAVDEGLIKADDLISETWAGEGELSHPHKYLDQGYHKTLTWYHLIGPKDDKFHYGGFPVTNGYYWRKASYAHGQTSWGQGFYAPSNSAVDTGRPVPDWANWTGDPFYDNYSHIEPGTVGIYSSGGIWRLSQALTALWNQDLKQVLDEKLFSKIGISADRWDWTPGRVVHEDKSFYPHMPGYGDFLDPPYEINGHRVRGGGGWAVMSAKDLARFGLLVATGGVWKGERLIGSDWVRNHGGGNGSFLTGDARTYISFGVVATVGLPAFADFSELVVGPVVGPQ
jgi:CubicO group peptidase (beta-lactamase class C family)